MEEEKIVLMSRYGENNYLERIPNVDTITYVLKTESNTVRVGTENNINMYVDPSGGPMIGIGYQTQVGQQTLELVEIKDCKLKFKNADTAALAGRRIKMKFMLDNARLYSVTVDGRPFLHDSPQKSVNLPYKYQEK